MSNFSFSTDFTEDRRSCSASCRGGQTGRDRLRSLQQAIQAESERKSVAGAARTKGFTTSGDTRAIRALRNIQAVQRFPACCELAPGGCAMAA